MKKKNGRSKIGTVIGSLTVLILFVASYPLFWFSNYKSHLNEFSYSIKNKDRDEAVRHLEKMREDYRLFSSWKLQLPADRFLFSKMHLYEAAASFLEEDYEKVEKTHLKGRDDWESNSILGVSRFWALYDAYQVAMLTGDKKQMEAIAELAVTVVKSDFEKCVKDGPGPVDNFNCSFNYDLLSDPENAEKALKNKKPKTRYVLGPPKDGKDKAPGKKQSPKMRPDQDKKAGSGGSKKIG